MELMVINSSMCRNDGLPFWNLLHVAPIRDHTAKVCPKIVSSIRFLNRICLFIVYGKWEIEAEAYGNWKMETRSEMVVPIFLGIYKSHYHYYYVHNRECSNHVNTYLQYQNMMYSICIYVLKCYCIFKFVTLWVVF